MRNMDDFFNKEKPIEYIVEVNIYYQGHKERTDIDVIEEQKQSIILEIPWLAYHNPKINWRTKVVRMMRCLEECKKQQRLKQRKLGWKKKRKKRGKKKKEKRKKREN